MKDTERFERAKEKIIGITKDRNTIGLLQEKTVHAVLKNYFEPDEDKQEIPIETYVADIYNGKEIIEIQTAQFNRLREKLRCYLKEYKVRVVHPIQRETYIVWIDRETGEYQPARKSPLKGKPYHIFPELYKIKEFLLDENLHFTIVMLDVEEFRFINKNPKRRKKSAGKYDKLPLRICEEICIECRQDFMQFVPIELEGDFDSMEFAKAAYIHVSLARVVLNILNHVGVVEKVGKRGNSILYAVKEEY